MILGRMPKYLVVMDAAHIDRWLGKLEGWEEVDSMCDEIDVWFRADIKERLNDLNHFNKDKQTEKHVMITKAISWLLRSLIKYHKNEVTVYLKKNSLTLPKIAVREVRRKLETGKK